MEHHHLRHCQTGMVLIDTDTVHILFDNLFNHYHLFSSLSRLPYPVTPELISLILSMDHRVRGPSNNLTFRLTKDSVVFSSAEWNFVSFSAVYGDAFRE